jgi:cell division septation protein DedD
VVRLPPAEGIVDAFEYGVSLTKTAREIDGVFFIGTGSYTANAGALLSQDRWRRLHAGFRSEGALLLVYLAPEAAPRLGAVADGAIALAPQGVESGSTADRALAAVSERGTPMLGVVRERWSAPTVSPPPAPPPPLRGRPRRSLPATIAIALAAAAGWALFARSAEQPVGSGTPVTPQLPEPVRADTVPWTVQLAAYGTMDGAMQHVKALAGEGVPALVAPVVLSRAGTVWYRVLAGSYAGRDAAAAARAAFWEAGTARRGEGELLHAPYALTLGGAIVADSLWRLGIPAIKWTDGRWLVGAFESPEQAAPTQSALARAGVRATLATRTDTTP